MNVLEKILEEISEVEKEYVTGHKVLYALGATGMATEISGIIRSHMNEVPNCGECNRRKWYQIGYEDGSYRLEAYENDLTQGYAESQLSIIRVYKIKNERNFKHIMDDDNLELIWERKEPKKMTVEEMRQKLEELTGKEIEVTE